MNKKTIRSIVKKILYLPISPSLTKVGVDCLRYLGFLKKESKIEKKGYIRRILISHPYASVGDVVLVLPLVEQVRQLWPDSLIDIVVGANMAELFVGHRDLNQVFRYNASRIKRTLVRKYVEIFRVFILYRSEIMQWNYDLAIVPRWDSDAHAFVARYLAYLTSAPYRCGYSAKVDGGDATIDDLLTHVAQGGNLEHEILRYTRLLGRVGLANIDMDDITLVKEPIKRMIEVADATSTVELMRLAAGHIPHAFIKYVVISPGATNPRRIWSAEKLTQLMTMLYRQYKLPFLIIGAQSDALLCERLAQGMPDCAASFAGKTNMQQLTAIIRNSALFIGNDSGPGHIAGAVGVPTLIASPFPLSCKIDHPNAPVRFHPSGPQVKVVQPATPLVPCDPYCNLDVAHCIEQVGVDDMFAAAKSLLEQN